MVQNRKTGPLPEDVTAEQLRARQKQPAASARQDSTNNQYAATSQKWWPMFLKAAQWDANDKAHWLDADGKPRDGIFRQLFIWLYEQDVSKSIFKTMLAWAQARLNQQLSERLLSPLAAYVCNLPGIKERKDEIFSNARQQHIEHMTDLQAAVESDIGFSQMDALIRRCMRCHVPQTSPLFSLQILFELRATHQQAARHDDLRTEVRRVAGHEDQGTRSGARVGSVSALIHLKARNTLPTTVNNSRPRQQK